MPVTRRVSGARGRIDVDADAAVVADNAVDIIRARVAAGRDIFDRPFVPYAPAYAEANGSSVVDLSTASPGGLLDTLRVRVQRQRDGVVVITVSPAPQHARVGTYLHEGTAHMRARPWLGFSPRDLLAIGRLLRT